MRRAASLCLLLLAAVLSPPAVRAEEGGPPVELEGWERLGPEGRWVRATELLARPEADPRALHEAFADREAYRLLEWLALYRPESEPVDRLYRKNAPNWVRVAIWRLNAGDSHAFGQVRSRYLARHPERVLGWILRFPDALALPGVDRLRANLLRQGVEPRADPEDLPPLLPATVFRHLEASPGVVAFDPDRPGAETEGASKGARFVHQVTRAIRGLEIVRQRPEAALEQLEALTRHAHEEIRHAAALAYSAMRPSEVPMARLLRMAHDPLEPGRVRRAALYAYASIEHPTVRMELIEIAAEPGSPIWRTAVARLADRSEGYAVWLFGAIPGGKLAEDARAFLARQKRRLERSFTERWADRPGSAVRDQLERAAWFEQSGWERARDYLDHTRSLLERHARRPEVEQVLRRVARGYDAAERHRGLRLPPAPADRTPVEAGALTQRVRALAAELLGD